MNSTLSPYQALREEAWQANLEIPARGLAIYTWGNVSAFDPARGVFAIKPSGVPYDALRPENMVVVDLEGEKVEGDLRPSSDTETHRVLYREWAAGRGAPLRGITHTHSAHAAAFAQALRPVPVFGTTHADHCPEEIPCTPYLDEDSMRRNYERETGSLIVRTVEALGRDPSRLHMILVAGHGPFTWGDSAAQSVYHAAVLEEVCRMALLTLTLDPEAKPLPAHLIRKHWERKHGPAAYYGQ
ncbi:MAG: L-ribulose-5-phosphate 4-epimerase AraD [Treponema sp.]|jgi:L-ribulose-5-phosphate 4-epimerase|nr:L-ribulose-5-phosphate 4-epimerase AraD [Treponema sp.]